MLCYNCSDKFEDEFEDGFVIHHCDDHAAILLEFRTMVVNSLPEKVVELANVIIDLFKLLAAVGDEHSPYVLQTLIDLANSFEIVYDQKNVCKMLSCCNMMLDFLTCIKFDSTEENQNLIEEIISTIQELMLKLILIP